MVDHLFVYGTLMQNHDNYYAQLIQENGELIGKGFIYAQKYDLGDYPGIKISTTKVYKTTGEIYKINNNVDLVFTELDYYEGYIPENPKDSLFIRKEVTVFINENNQYSAWVYEYAGNV